MNKIAKFIAIALAAVIVILLGVLIFVNPQQKGNLATDSATMMPNYPTSPDGHVRVGDPIPGQIVTSPGTISGWVTGGGWFFEATFPVKVVDADGTVLGAGRAEAKQGEWTSTGTVLFMGTISFSTPHSATGTVVFLKDNPSGAPYNDESFSVPVRFRQ
jgi:hypothetical protein